MIILVNENNGEQYEDYYSWIEGVYDLPTTSLALHIEYSTFLIKKAKEVGIEIMFIDSFFLPFLSGKSLKLTPDSYGPIQGIKAHKIKLVNLLKEHNIHNYIANTYNTKSLKFETINN